MKLSSVNLHKKVILLAIVLNWITGVESKFIKDDDTSFVIHFCVAKEWMCSGAYIDKVWILTTSSCAWNAEMDMRTEAVVSNGTFDCKHAEKRDIRQSFVYTKKFFSLDTDIGLIKVKKSFKRNVDATRIEMSIYEVKSKTCYLYGSPQTKANADYATRPLKRFQSKVLESEECQTLYNIEPHYFICLAKVPGVVVWHFPVVCEGALEGFVVADDETLVLALRLVVFQDWIQNQTSTTELRSDNSGAEIHLNFFYILFVFAYVVDVNFTDK